MSLDLDFSAAYVFVKTDRAGLEGHSLMSGLGRLLHRLAIGFEMAAKHVRPIRSPHWRQGLSIRPTPSDDQICRDFQEPGKNHEIEYVERIAITNPQGITGDEAFLRR